MSKLYNRYIELKKENKETLYLFKSGIFYVFLEDDAYKISKITTLKCTWLTSNVIKCGFPENSLNRYLEIFKELNLNVEIIELKKTKIGYGKYKSIDDLKTMNLDLITPIKALEILYGIKKELENNE